MLAAILSSNGAERWDPMAVGGRRSQQDTKGGDDDRGDRVRGTVPGSFLLVAS